MGVTEAAKSVAYAVHSLFGTQNTSKTKYITLSTHTVRYSHVHLSVNNKYLIVRKDQPLPSVYRKCSYHLQRVINISFPSNAASSAELSV